MRTVRMTILAMFACGAFLAACDSKMAAPRLGRYTHVQSGYTMDINLSGIGRFELNENDEPQVKGVYTVPSPGNGVFEVTDVCFDGEIWFTFEEMKEVTNWDRTVPFTFDHKTMTFLMPDMPSIELSYQD